MGKIGVALASVATEFQLIEPGVYELEVKKATEVQKNGQLAAYRINSEIVGPIESEAYGRTFSDYINLRQKDGEFSDPGLASLKRYFEVTFGIDEVSGPKGPDGKRTGGWSDDQFDTDLLIGKRWRGQIIIDSYTKEGETEPRKNNKATHMESL